MGYDPVIGLEVHAELQTRSKIFCSCPVVDRTQSPPNAAVCPVCAGMPGALPVLNRRAVEYSLRVALALGCKIYHTSIFERKNYFYPDLPKGYQISQFAHPLAREGSLRIHPSQGERTITIRRVHLEEDTGKLTHVHQDGESFSLVDLNRAGVPLLEIVSEPELYTLEDVRAYTAELHTMLRYLDVTSGDMSKGLIRFEANVSMRRVGSDVLGTRVEIKNLNSFRAMQRAISFEIDRQTNLLENGELVRQETLGWDEDNQVTVSQRGKEDAHDYRYFPEPDLPPLLVDEGWIQQVRDWLPELPYPRLERFQAQYGLSWEDARMLTEDSLVADYFENCVRDTVGITAETVLNWLSGEIFAWINQSGESIDRIKVEPAMLAGLLSSVNRGAININTAKSVLGEMLRSGRSAECIIKDGGLQQIFDEDTIMRVVKHVIEENPDALASYQSGKETIQNWFFGQAMKAAKGKANPQMLQAELERQLIEYKLAR
ncbi:MAG: Asp-tRNA(Asn)/Glu-tRNA(Gln) amidotransferase subunit GatB [Anaerolineaceae bacterium]|nr:Asp-tRNA(Asn)/Glu-tRNA(Gln) amidotransferase subunit GatB [Anaerolineaceae bacterium]